MTGARQRVLETAEGGLAWTRSGLAHAAGVSSTVIDGLRAQGVFETVMIPPRPVVAAPDSSYAIPELMPDQSDAALMLRANVAAGVFNVALLDGVTGSGKTEVYFEAVAAALDQGKQVLILLPEIALTHAFLERFQQRFGAKPGEWHSDLPPRMREKVWRQVAEGGVRVVAGARSALFLPFKELGLIVVDEEHEAAYKQEDGVFYMPATWPWCAAISRTFRWCWPRRRPRWKAASMPSAGATTISSFRALRRARIADARAVDCARQAAERGRFLSPVLLNQIARQSGGKEQSLLFLNRRGYAPLTLCRDCGHRFRLPELLGLAGRTPFSRPLVCHHCGHVERRPHECPECHARSAWSPAGRVSSAWPRRSRRFSRQARTIVLSSDPGGRERLRLELMAVAEGEFDIVIGTQLVAKGHNFPGMTLVGVVDADLGLTWRSARGRAHLPAAQPGHGPRRPHRQEEPWPAADLPARPSGDAGDRLRRRRGFLRARDCRARTGALPPFGRLAAPPL
jgi:primosomal protein N' (replication factor Y)